MLKKLEMNRRDLSIKTNRILASNDIPGILYGKHLPQSIPVQTSAKNFHQQIHKKGELYRTKVDGVNYLLKIASIQRDPVSRKIIHFSLQEFNSKDKIDIEIPIDFKGNSVGVKHGGVLLKLVEKLQVRGLAKNIPDKIELNIKDLDIGDVFTVRDIKSQKGFEVLDDLNEVVVVCRPPSLIVASEEPAEAEMNG
ncbi:MAG: 50S ribosomal protein L25 [Halobacteriovoraceae bacterium]|nr:50S ribosomal protein L25 [Halobacteriovoraceae bacterium]